jgi:threonine dehydrogenase-like Zn-dependent dehydrogenase
MRGFVIRGPRDADVEDVPEPTVRPGQVIVDVGRAGVCGTDVEFFTGDMAYLHDGSARFPIRIGHEWMGVVTSIGEGVDRSWLGRRVTGDTMLGCGVCERCRDGRQHLCATRSEIGVRSGWPGALAERLPVPVRALHALPDEVDDAMGALVEPGGNALRAVRGADIDAGDDVLVMGVGTIGLLVAMFARARGARVHLVGRSSRSIDFARSIGFDVTTEADLPERPWRAVIDASNAPTLPARVVELVEPGKRVVYVGLAGVASPVDSRQIVMKDLTVVGVLSASGGLEDTIRAYAVGAVDPRPLVAATVGLEQIRDILAGQRPQGSGAGPKFHAIIRERSSI